VANCPITVVIKAGPPLSTGLPRRGTIVARSLKRDSSANHRVKQRLVGAATLLRGCYYQASMLLYCRKVAPDRTATQPRRFEFRLLRQLNGPIARGTLSLEFRTAMIP